MIEYGQFKEILTTTKLLNNLKIFKMLKNRFKYYMNDGYLDYYLNMLNKYEKTKTLLHRQPTYFYDIYFPSKLEVYDNEFIETKSVKELFNNEHYLTVIGDAGSGKSMLVQHLFINSIYEAYKAPIIIFLRDIDTEKNTIEEYIKNIILRNNLSNCEEILEETLNSGEFIFFLDGYDEIKSDKKSLITSHLKEFIQKYFKNDYLITSRPSSNIEYFYKFNNYYISDLCLQDIPKFIRKQVSDGKQANDIILSIAETKNSYVHDFITNNLLLTLYILTFNKNNKLPNKKSRFYYRVFEVLFIEHDSATKNSYERERKSLLSQENFEEILTIFSFLSFFQSQFNMERNFISNILSTIKTELKKYNFSNNDFISDMILSVGLWTEDGGIISFAHKSIQEYFVANHIKQLSYDNKKKVYLKLNDINTKKNLYNDLDIKNLLTLCSEMDRTSFIEFFLLGNLKDIINILHEYNTNEKLHLLFDSIHADIGHVRILFTKEFSLILNTKVFYNYDGLDIKQIFEEIKYKIEKKLNIYNCHKYFIAKGLTSRGHMFIIPKILDIEYLEYINIEKIVSDINQLVIQIENQIEQYIQEIKQYNDNEKVFLSMI
ncbi:MAG: NACHT domain-containing protein [Aliarcobacter sp.]|nr:NACHT domain-containing protein [Aliarcobacter sp.]